MRKFLALTVVAGLIGGYVGAAPAQGARLVPKTSKFFLRDDNVCESPDYLSRKDGPDSGCWQSDSFLNEPIISQAGLIDRDEIADHFVARDGVPLTLNAKKAITGTIATYSGSCYDAAVPCAPVGVGVGQAQVDIIVRAFINGAEVVLGEQTATFEVVPGDPHVTEVNLEIDDALNKKKVTSLRVSIFFHGAALFHSGVELENPASSISVPTLVKK